MQDFSLRSNICCAIVNSEYPVDISMPLSQAINAIPNLFLLLKWEICKDINIVSDDDMVSEVRQIGVDNQEAALIQKFFCRTLSPLLEEKVPFVELSSGYQYSMVLDILDNFPYKMKGSDIAITFLNTYSSSVDDKESLKNFLHKLSDEVYRQIGENINLIVKLLKNENFVELEEIGFYEKLFEFINPRIKTRVFETVKSDDKILSRFLQVEYHVPANGDFAMMNIEDRCRLVENIVKGNWQFSRLFDLLNSIPSSVAPSCVYALLKLPIDQRISVCENWGEFGQTIIKGIRTFSLAERQQCYHRLQEFTKINRCNCSRIFNGAVVNTYQDLHDQIFSPNSRSSGQYLVMRHTNLTTTKRMFEENVIDLGDSIVAEYRCHDFAEPDNFLVSFDKKSGEINWDVRFEKNIAHLLLTSKGIIVLPKESDTLMQLDATSGEITDTCQLPFIPGVGSRALLYSEKLAKWVGVTWKEGGYKVFVFDERKGVSYYDYPKNIEGRWLTLDGRYCLAGYYDYYLYGIGPVEIGEIGFSGEGRPKFDHDSHKALRAKA